MISMYIVSDCNTLWKMQSFDNIICQNQGLTLFLYSCSECGGDIETWKSLYVYVSVCVCVCVCGGGGGGGGGLFIFTMFC